MPTLILCAKWSFWPHNKRLETMNAAPSGSPLETNPTLNAKPCLLVNAACNRAGAGADDGRICAPRKPCTAGRKNQPVSGEYHHLDHCGGLDRPRAGGARGLSVRGFLSRFHGSQPERPGPSAAKEMESWNSSSPSSSPASSAPCCSSHSIASSGWSPARLLVITARAVHLPTPLCALSGIAMGASRMMCSSRMDRTAWALAPERFCSKLLRETHVLQDAHVGGLCPRCRGHGLLSAANEHSLWPLPGTAKEHNVGFEPQLRTITRDGY